MFQHKLLLQLKSINHRDQNTCEANALIGFPGNIVHEHITFIVVLLRVIVI